MIPVARSKKLLIQELGEEVIVYDQERNTTHCLNSLAARVWYCCDGKNTIEDITKILEEELEIPLGDNVDLRGRVSRIVDELESFHLIDGYLLQPTNEPKISRRWMMKKAALVSGFAMGALLPTIKSIVAPAPAMASSGPPLTTRPPLTTTTRPPFTTTAPPPFTTAPPPPSPAPPPPSPAPPPPPPTAP